VTVMISRVFVLCSFVVALCLSVCASEGVAPLGKTIACSLEKGERVSEGVGEGNCAVDGYVGSTVIFEDESVSE
jgi:hypothetical protein